MPALADQKLFELGPDATPYKKLTSEGVSAFEVEGRAALKVDPAALTLRRGRR